MAKKEEAPNMVERFAEFKELKNIDKTTMVSVLEESFRNVLEKMFGTDKNLDVIMNPDKGDVQIFQNLEVVPDGEVQDKNLQISLSDAHADNDPDAEIGEEHTKEIFFADFGRRAILNLRQTLQSKILDLQKEAVYNKFKELEGQLVSAEVYQPWSRETLLLDDDKNELLLPKSESIPASATSRGDFFRKGETILAVIADVDNKNNNPKITVSRTNNTFLQRLFERDIPEIRDGLITVRAIARIPGQRAKVAVESYDPRIDAPGACIGIKGSRIHGISRELCNENIDVISYSADPEMFIRRALKPAEVSQVRLDPDGKKAEVFLAPDQVALAIGANGNNIKLASQLTGFEIDVYRDTAEPAEEDIYLDDFRDEIEGWIIDQIKQMGCVTARNVLACPRQKLIDEADLEEETVDYVIGVLKAEFEEDDDEAQPQQEQADDATADEAAEGQPQAQEVEESVLLDDFRDEIDGWIIDQLQQMGCRTAHDVLALPRQALVDDADLEEETADFVIGVLKAEVEPEEPHDQQTANPETADDKTEA